MIVFYATAAWLTLLAIAWMVRPLVRPTAPTGASSQQLNADIYRDQLQALDRDLARGAISTQDHSITLDELQLRLLDDTQASNAPETAVNGSVLSTRLTAIAIALILPLGAAGMYWWLGTPGAIDPDAQRKATTEKITQMVDGLAAKLKANPDNPMGWAMLARSYKVMGRLDDAEQAFAKATAVIDTDADMLVEYADLLAVRAGGTIEGKPLALIRQALKINPQHPMGLMLNGIAAYRRADFAGAVAQWEKLLAIMEPGSPEATQMEADIADARAQAALAKKGARTKPPATP
jgi:cytochrome c-type biogenesis protein CcmH